MSPSQDSVSGDRLLQWEQLLAQGQSHKFPAFLKGISEKERAEYASVAIKCHKKYLRAQTARSKNSPEQTAAPTEYFSHFTTPLGLLMTADVEQLADFSWAILRDENFEIDLLEKVRPESLRSFGVVLLRQDAHFIGVVRDWIMRDLIDKPTSDDYITSLIGVPYIRTGYGNDYASLYELLKAEKDILEEDIWRFFEQEGDHENNLATRDNRAGTDYSWSITLRRLSSEGIISRQRLLQSSLIALERSFSQYRSSWFSHFHEDLKPTVEERASLIESYGKLLGSAIAPTASYSLKALEKVDRKYPLPEAFISRHFLPVMIAEQKIVVTTAFTILARAVSLDKTFANQACLLAANTLQHESPELEELAVAFIESNADATNELLKQKLLECFDAVSPRLMPRIRKWLDDSAPVDIRTEHQHCSYEMAEPSASDWPIRTDKEITPIKTVEELLSTTALCLEDSSRVEDLERIFDGVARLKLPQSEKINLLTGPLKKRAADCKSAKERLRSILAYFVYAWLSKTELEVAPSSNLGDLHPCVTFLQTRLQLILARVKAGQYLPLFSTPTHSGGWIDPAALLARQVVWTEVGQTPDDYDLPLALLRLPLPAREQLARNLELNAPLRQALQFLIGVDDGSYEIESNLSQAAKFIRPPVDPSYCKILAVDFIFGSARHSDLIRWRAFALPVVRECEYALGVRWAATLIDSGLDSHERSVSVYFELLTESGAPLERRALILMAIGLIIGDAECESHARDAIILAIDEKRLDTEKFGREVSAFLYRERGKSARLSKSLAEIARVSDNHSDAVRQIIEKALPNDASKIPPGFSNILELLNEILGSSQMQMQDQKAREYLQSLKTGGKTKTLIDSILKQ